MEDLITIEEILTEANAYGVRNEVRELAIAFRSLSFTDDVNNYQISFNYIVNNDPYYIVNNFLKKVHK